MDPVSYSLKVPAIEKLIDYGASGVGAIAGPLLAPVKARQEAKARLIAAETDAQIREIEARSDASALKIIAEAQAEAQAYLLPADADFRAKLDITPQDIAQSFEFQGKKRLANARTVLEAAADELGDKEVDDHEPDADWTARFFDYVQDVSSEEMQKIWAKILAGEVETPGRTSLRTLSILRNMSQSEAKSFAGFMKFRISDYILVEFAQTVTNEPLDTHYLVMVDIGLAYSAMTAFPSITLSSNGTYDREHHGHILRIEGPPRTEINPMELDTALLTPSGKELARFCEHEPNLEYLSCFARFLETQNCSLKIAPIVSKTPDGRMQFYKKEVRTL